MGSLAVHCNPAIQWQSQWATYFLSGLEALGIPAHITTNQQRESDLAVLLGTTYWRSVEATGNYLLVDRASVGDPDYAQLVWNGHGRRGDHKVSLYYGEPADRWYAMADKLRIEPQPWRHGGTRVVLCGQTETYSPLYREPLDWYQKIRATHFRKHPAGANPTALPMVVDWEDTRVAITLNSSVAVSSVLQGVPTVTMDEAAMAWDVTGHHPDEIYRPDREEWLAWLACTQWHREEIEAGKPIRHLFEDM